MWWISWAAGRSSRSRPRQPPRSPQKRYRLPADRRPAPRGSWAAWRGGGTGPRADRLPEQVRITYADPGMLYLRCGSFGRATYANEIAAQLSGLGADVLRSHDGRQTVYAVRAGPFATIAQADRALAEALRDGVIDARITIE